MSTVLFPGQHYHLYQCNDNGHYHILSRRGTVSQPCWSRAALISLIRDLKMTLPDELDEIDRQDSLADLAAIMSMVNALAQKRNRRCGKFADGFVLSHDWQPGEEREVPRDWQEFRSGRSPSIGVMIELAGDERQTLAPLLCDFVGRTETLSARGTISADELVRLAGLPARVIPQAELGIEWQVPEAED